MDQTAGRQTRHPDAYDDRLDYEALRRQLSAAVEPAYDGMVIEFD